MFTGIVEELGVVRKIIHRGNHVALEIRAKTVLGDIKIGDSVAVNGACLTVTKKEKDCLTFDAMRETVDITNLGELSIGDVVNLERALKIGDRLSGHFVTGHIDVKARIRKKSFIKDNLCFEIMIPQKLSKYIVTKGSIAIDGISLTVVNTFQNSFSVYIIPHTIKNTTLKYKNVASVVNIELDMLAKYTVDSR